MHSNVYSCTYGKDANHQVNKYQKRKRTYYLQYSTYTYNTYCVYYAPGINLVPEIEGSMSLYVVQAYVCNVCRKGSIPRVGLQVIEVVHV